MLSIILQIISVSLFEKILLNRLLKKFNYTILEPVPDKQLFLFDPLPDSYNSL